MVLDLNRDLYRVRVVLAIASCLHNVLSIGLLPARRTVQNRKRRSPRRWHDSATALTFLPKIAGATARKKSELLELNSTGPSPVSETAQHRAANDMAAD